MKLGSFKDFVKVNDSSKLEEAIGVSSRKLQKATEEFHMAQLDLQTLQKKFISLSKEDASRELIKKQIIAQHKVVKQKEALFAKALGDEDI